MRITREIDFNKIESFLKLNFSAPTHWPDWNLLISKYYNTEFFYFCGYENNELIGICPMHKNKKGLLENFYSGQFHFIPYGGWIFSRQIEVNYRKLLLPILYDLQSFALPSIKNFNVLNLKVTKEFQTLLIDLTKSLEVIWEKDLDANRRNMIRKAEKNGVIVKEQKNLTDFYSFYYSANKRLGLPVYPEELIKELFALSDNIHFLVLDACFQDAIISNIVVVYDKDYSLYWLGNNHSDLSNLGQGELLQWEAIKRMKEKGCKYYDLCFIDKIRFPNIYKFKIGFTRKSVFIPYIQRRSLITKIIYKLRNGTRVFKICI